MDVTADRIRRRLQGVAVKTQMTEIRRIARVLWAGESATRHYVGLPADLARPSDTQKDFLPTKVLLL